MKPKTHKPIGPFVLVEKIEQKEEVTDAGIIIVEDGRRAKKQYSKVLALGRLINKNKTQTLPMDLRIGDTVMYCKGEGVDLGNNQELVAYEKLFAKVGKE